MASERLDEHSTVLTERLSVATVVLPLDDPVEPDELLHRRAEPDVVRREETLLLRGRRRVDGRRDRIEMVGHGPRKPLDGGADLVAREVGEEHQSKAHGIEPLGDRVEVDGARWDVGPAP